MGLMDWIQWRLGIRQMRSDQVDFEGQMNRWHNDMEARVRRLESEVEVRRTGGEFGKRESRGADLDSDYPDRSGT